MEIAGSHKLDLPYDSPCRSIHGHNWKITVYCKSDKLNGEGMVVDFKDIKMVVNGMDHKHLNDFVKQPTAENIAKYICDSLPYCYKVDVQESENNTATYEMEDF